MLALFLSGEFLLHIPCLLIFSFIFLWGVCLTHPMLFLFVSLSLFSCGEFLLDIPCWLYFYMGSFLIYLGSFSYTSRAGLIFIWGVSLTHPVLASFLCREFLIHIPCCFQFYARSLSYTFRDGFFFFSFFFFFIWGVSITNPMLVLLFIGRIALTHLVLASFLSGEFLLHIPCWHHFSVGSFSYTSRAGFIFIWGVSYTSHTGFLFSVGSFSYTSHAGFFFCFFVFVSFLFLSVEFHLHIPCWLRFFFFYVGSFSGMQSSLKTTPKEKSWTTPKEKSLVEDGPDFIFYFLND